jgi:DNA-directed RNA polymerase specialized sigma24 family protein
VPSLSVRQHLAAWAPRQDGGRDGTATGIDLAARGSEVRKLFYAGGFTGTLLREGIDPEEFLQEVLLGLAVRNRGKCPWDAAKSSFGHYVHIVMRGVLSNYLRKVRRANQFVGLTATGEAPNVAGKAPAVEDCRAAWDELLLEAYPDSLERAKAVEMVALLDSGLSRREVAARMGTGVEWVTTQQQYLRGLLSP